MSVNGSQSGVTVGFFGPSLRIRQPDHARCIDLLASQPVGLVLGPALARQAPLPVRLIFHLDDRAPEAILVSDTLECSEQECLLMTSAGTQVVILAMLPLAAQERRYAHAGAAAYLNLIVDDRLVSVLDALASNQIAEVRSHA